MVQNAAARVLTRTRKYDHISPVLSTLHWLPTKHRIDFNPLSAKVAKLRQDVILDQIDRSSLSGVISHLYSLPLDGRHVVLRF